MAELKVAVLTDGRRVPDFGLRAIDSLRDCAEITVFACTNTQFRRRPLRHAAYYLLNLAAVRNRLTRAVPIDRCRKHVAGVVEFESGYEGAWQTLPPAVIEQLSRFDIVVKLGMGLLRVPPPERLPAPILSWHHGDPDRYRGRPAGFWEMVHRAPVMGQIVQILSNRLDAGPVVAFAETKVHPHSYRATLLEAYGHSPLLLNEAVRRALAGAPLRKAAAGRNYRLPSNLAVLAFVLRMAWNFGRRAVYGAFVEKLWRVSLAPLPAAGSAAIVRGETFPEPGSWRTLATPRGYLFLADPFFSCDPPGLLVEALNRRTSRGEIMLVTDEEARPVSGPGGHLSYPAPFACDGAQCIVPEMVERGRQRIFSLRGERMAECGTLDIEGDPLLVDPTLLDHEGRVYLFANDLDRGSGALFLWTADSLRGRFRLHPSSPIRISPSGSRMAGQLVRAGERLFRFGQSFVHGYGDGVVAFEVTRLTPTDYREGPIGTIRFGDRKGPHTINFDGDRLVFDWYRERLSPLSGVRRVIARLRARRAARDGPGLSRDGR